MVGLLDRAFQREILNKLASVYPKIPNFRRLFHEDWDARQDEYVRNIHYLYEHGLVTAKFSQPINGPIDVVIAQITARGLDFLADDGGLSAILGVLTVKLHEDTIKALLVQKVEAAAGDATVKSNLIAKIKEVPSEALGTVTQRALEAGLDHAPDLLGSLSKWLGL